MAYHIALQHALLLILVIQELLHVLTVMMALGWDRNTSHFSFFLRGGFPNKQIETEK